MATIITNVTFAAKIFTEIVKILFPSWWLHWLPINVNLVANHFSINVIAAINISWHSNNVFLYDTFFWKKWSKKSLASEIFFWPLQSQNPISLTANDDMMTAVQRFFYFRVEIFCLLNYIIHWNNESKIFYTLKCHSKAMQP